MGLVSLLLLAGAIVLMLFVILSGVKNTTPLNKTYFLSADTSNISGARSISQWTYFHICGAGNKNCGAAVPALPLRGSYDFPSANGVNVPSYLACVFLLRSKSRDVANIFSVARPTCLTTSGASDGSST